MPSGSACCALTLFGEVAMDRAALSFFGLPQRVIIALVLPTVLSACAQLSVSPKQIQPADPAVAARAIEAEAIPPREVLARDFEVSPVSVKENGSPLHRLISVFRKGSAEQRRLATGRRVAAAISQETVKQLKKLGLQASRSPDNSYASAPDDVLLITGRVIDANEGNRLTRIALGCGAGESRLDTEIHVFRVASGERAEVLAFTTHADSGKMPGLVPSLGAGQLFVGTVTVFARVKAAVSGGEKIYASQMDHLATRTGSEVARYFSQYAAQQGWIPRKDAESLKVAAE
jgi:Domain of unknown function (DUF4410)